MQEGGDFTWTITGTELFVHVANPILWDLGFSIVVTCVLDECGL